MQKKFKVVFKNQIDLEVFSKDFYQTLLENIIKLKEHKEIQIDNRTCPCLDTSELQNGISTCACLDTSQTCLSQAKCKRKHV